MNDDKREEHAPQPERRAKLQRPLIAAMVTSIGLIIIYLNGVGRAGELLTLASEAPAFSATFIQGDSFRTFEPGKVYVIEFSGTQCVPCIRAIAHMEELQRTHAEAVFVTVFAYGPPAVGAGPSEAQLLQNVKKFLRGPGKAMTSRAACDTSGTMQTNWMHAAGRNGIPLVFVVDAQGKVAWIGRPDGLDEPLADIVAGKHDYTDVDPVAKMHLEIEKRLLERRRSLRLLEYEAQTENNKRITGLIKGGKLAEAVQALREAEAKYRELPNKVAVFRARRLFVLGLIPGTKDEAFHLARDIVVNAKLEGETPSPRPLLNHYESCTAENRDERMIDLTLAVIAESEQAPNLTLDERIAYLHNLARAYELRHNLALASSAIREAAQLQQVRIEQMTKVGERGLFIEEGKRSLNRLKKRLQEYEAEHKASLPPSR